MYQLGHDKFKLKLQQATQSVKDDPNCKRGPILTRALVPERNSARVYLGLFNNDGSILLHVCRISIAVLHAIFQKTVVYKAAYTPMLSIHISYIQNKKNKK